MKNSEHKKYNIESHTCEFPNKKKLSALATVKPSSVYMEIWNEKKHKFFLFF